MKETIVIVTGGFDPIHEGHIRYFESAAKLGSTLIVGLNSDAWLIRKKGTYFMNWTTRSSIIESLRMVSKVISFDDSDNSAIDAIKKVKEMYPDAKLIFANGGDRTKDNIPEMVFDDVEFAFGVGGENKANSSSWLLKDWEKRLLSHTERKWGYWEVLHEIPKNNVKVKKLVVSPGESLSMQRHYKRNEFWVVAEGRAILKKEYVDLHLNPNDNTIIHVEEWHQLTNPYDVPCTVIEVQYGELCEESDIERK